jgi:hypothetical protein
MSSLPVIAVIISVIAVIISVSILAVAVLNYWRHRNAGRPDLVVRPHARYFPDPYKPNQRYVGFMEVHNKGGASAIDWTIGFLPRRRQDKEIPLVGWLQDAELPLWGEFKPQVHAEPQFKLEGLPDTDKLGRAFARTKGGDTFKASRRDMRIFAKERKAAST